ncbi:hypothetical protein [Winogradskyella alexanderae]|uniref:Uncharacterized protein n=1 Tax=Winogradskyella alexanderae TaxID=2877123 RepID=A0ABS7XTI1_9FLAO|nr:hypothetical protein [Winogradskyella alexanderae]MCA0133340.1 hypothetical protein [Winogradskyella alexanderae]
MRKFILPFVMLVGLLATAQSKSVEEIEIRKEVKVNCVEVTVTVDSLEELQETFSINDLEEVFGMTGEDESVTFKLVCNGDKMSNGKKSSMSYKIEGSTSDKETFIKQAEAIRKAAIKFYKNKA